MKVTGDPLPILVCLQFGMMWNFSYSLSFNKHYVSIVKPTSFEILKRKVQYLKQEMKRAFITALSISRLRYFCSTNEVQKNESLSPKLVAYIFL